MADELSGPGGASEAELLLTRELRTSSQELRAERSPRPPRRVGLACLALAAVLLGLYACLVAARRRLPAARSKGLQTVTASEVLPLEEEPLEAESACAALGKSCLRSKCCADPGFQCFEKSKHWAACRPFCVPGRDPTDNNNDTWSCRPLGPTTPGEAPPPDYEVKPAPWVATFCSGNGEDCSKALCCREAGAQCFRKTHGWSSCKAECTPGPDPTDADNHSWNCTPLGMRTPGPPLASLGVAQPWVQLKCAAPGENCLEKRCCKAPGMQCYKKHDTWAMCMDRCTHGPLLTDANSDIWNCTALGGRTPGIPQVSKNVRVADWVKTDCAKAGENCSRSMCCADETLQCYTKNKEWASCLRGCAKGPHQGDTAGGSWECLGLGVRTPRPWGWPSLYCFSVVMLSSYEAGIMRQALRTSGGVGIFSCELHDVFSQDGETWLGDGPNGQVRTHHFNPAPVTKSVDGTAGNTALFINVWTAVREVGAYALTDWTVKVDPDAVMFADRLRFHLKGHTGSPTFIINCNKDGMVPMMFGSVEAISKQAMEKYFNSGNACHNNYQFGEDRWMGECLKSLLVYGTEDFGMVGDKVCKGANCADGKAAYHYFKNEADWIGCFNTATR